MGKFRQIRLRETSAVGCLGLILFYSLGFSTEVETSVRATSISGSEALYRWVNQEEPDAISIQIRNPDWSWKDDYRERVEFYAKFPNESIRFLYEKEAYGLYHFKIQYKTFSYFHYDPFQLQPVAFGNDNFVRRNFLSLSYERPFSSEWKISAKFDLNSRRGRLVDENRSASDLFEQRPQLAIANSSGQREIDQYQVRVAVELRRDLPTQDTRMGIEGVHHQNKEWGRTSRAFLDSQFSRDQVIRKQSELNQLRLHAYQSGEFTQSFRWALDFSQRWLSSKEISDRFFAPLGGNVYLRDFFNRWSFGRLQDTGINNLDVSHQLEQTLFGAVVSGKLNPENTVRLYTAIEGLDSDGQGVFDRTYLRFSDGIEDPSTSKSNNRWNEGTLGFDWEHHHSQKIDIKVGGLWVRSEGSDEDFYQSTLEQALFELDNTTKKEAKEVYLKLPVRINTLHRVLFSYDLRDKKSEFNPIRSTGISFYQRILSPGFLSENKAKRHRFQFSSNHKIKKIKINFQARWYRETHEGRSNSGVELIPSKESNSFGGVYFYIPLGKNISLSINQSYNKSKIRYNSANASIHNFTTQGWVHGMRLNHTKVWGGQLEFEFEYQDHEVNDLNELSTFQALPYRSERLALNYFKSLGEGWDSETTLFFNSFKGEWDSPFNDYEALGFNFSLIRSF